jgi:hypothetical protein
VTIFSKRVANAAVDYAKFFNRSHDAAIRVYDEGGNVIETHDHVGELKERWVFTRITSQLLLK